MPTVFDHLPAAVRGLVPEVADGWTAEPKADCARCPMAAMGADVPPTWSFSPETRCCTAHPSLPNFLVGRALGRDESRELIVARLADPAGVSARGVFWPPAYEQRYHELVDSDGYGHDVTMRCPYWVGGERSCGIWRDRNSMCRAWHCKHERGRDGGVAWHRADVLVTQLELRLADILIARGQPPAGTIAPESIDAWIAWFAWCAEDIERLTPADVAPIATRDVIELRAELIQLRKRKPPLPDVVEPAISEMIVVGADVLLSGYSPFDGVRAPRTIFAFLARLSGRTPWRAALAAARAELREPAWLDEALVRQLYRVGAVREVEDTAAH